MLAILWACIFSYLFYATYSLVMEIPWSRKEQISEVCHGGGGLEWAPAYKGDRGAPIFVDDLQEYTEDIMEEESYERRGNPEKMQLVACFDKGPAKAELINECEYEDDEGDLVVRILHYNASYFYIVRETRTGAVVGRFKATAKGEGDCALMTDTERYISEVEIREQFAPITGSEHREALRDWQAGGGS